MDERGNPGLAERQGKPSWEWGDITCDLQTSVFLDLCFMMNFQVTKEIEILLYSPDSKANVKKIKSLAGWELCANVF